MIDNDTILRFIAAHPGCTTAQISEATHFPRNIISDRCARMVKAGLLTVERLHLPRADGKRGLQACFTATQRAEPEPERRRRLTSGERGDYTGERFLPFRYVPRAESYVSLGMDEFNRS